MIPRLDGADHVLEAVTFLRYPPEGTRGVALRTRGARLGSMAHSEVGEIDREVVGVVQIETAGSLREIEEIAAIDGVDVLFVGPADLSHSLGVPGRFNDPTYKTALASVVAAARRNGKAAGILLYDPATFADYLAMGFSFVGVGADGAFVATGAREALRLARGW